jgi:hypothetical protein
MIKRSGWYIADEVQRFIDGCADREYVSYVDHEKEITRLKELAKNLDNYTIHSRTRNKECNISGCTCGLKELREELEHDKLG